MFQVQASLGNDSKQDTHVHLVLRHGKASYILCAAKLTVSGVGVRRYGAGTLSAQQTSTRARTSHWGVLPTVVLAVSQWTQEAKVSGKFNSHAAKPKKTRIVPAVCTLRGFDSIDPASLHTCNIWGNLALHGRVVSKPHAPEETIGFMGLCSSTLPRFIRRG